MTVPRAVKEQAEAAERDLNDFVNGNAATDAQEATGAPEAPAAQPSVPLEIITPSGDMKTQEAQPAAAEGVTPEPKPVEETQDARTVSLDEYKLLAQRYLSLQGQFGDKNAKIKTLEERLTALETGQGSGRETAQQPALTDDDKEYLGDEGFDVHSRLSQSIVQGAIQKAIPMALAPLTARLEALEHTQVSTSTTGYWDQVETKIPGAKKIDAEDPRWMVWLETNTDSLSGLSFLDIANNAMRKGNVDRMAMLLQKYTAHAGITKQSPLGDNVTTQVKPVTARGGDNRPVKPARVRPSDIKEFYESVASGRFRGTNEDKQRIIAEFDKAAMEGRID